MFTLTIGQIALIILLTLIVGFITGFTTYSVLVSRAVKQGKIIIKGLTNGSKSEH